MFQDRNDAGRRLAERLGKYKDRRDVLVLALPRGGVVTGYEIAKALKAPLDVFIVRKIGHPQEPELAIGAVSETGTVALNQDIIDMHGISETYIEAEIDRQRDEIARRKVLYRRGKDIAGMDDKIILLVDDGVATGATMKASMIALKQEKIQKLVVALPVAPPEAAAQLKTMADELICLETPVDFMAVGVHYMNFSQTTDQEVIDLLRESAAEAA